MSKKFTRRIALMAAITLSASTIFASVPTEKIDFISQVNETKEIALEKTARDITSESAIEVGTKEEFLNYIANTSEATKIILTDDISMDEPLVFNKNVVVDLNGHTMKFSKGYNRLENGTKVEFKNGKMNFDSAVASQRGIWFVQLTSALTFNAVTIDADNYTSIEGFVNLNYDGELNILNSTLNLSNEQSAAAAIKAELLTAKINIINSEINFDNTQRGFMNGTITLKDSEVVIKNVDNAINSYRDKDKSLMLVVDNSQLSIENCTGRALTIYNTTDNDKVSCDIKNGSVVNFNNSAEGDIRFYTNGSIKVDNTSKFNFNTVTKADVISKENLDDFISSETYSYVLADEVTIDKDTKKINIAKYNKNKEAYEATNEEILRAALHVAKDGDTIILPSGSEIELESHLWLDKAVTIKGEGDIQPIIANNNIWVRGDKPVIFENIKFNITSPTDASSIYVWSLKSELTITNCTFDLTQFQAIQIYPQDNAKIEISNCTFTAPNENQKRFIQIQGARDEATPEYQENVEINIFGNTFNKIQNVQYSNGICILNIDLKNIKVRDNIFIDSDEEQVGQKILLGTWNVPVGTADYIRNVEFAKNMQQNEELISIAHGTISEDAHKFDNINTCTVCARFKEILDGSADDNYLITLPSNEDDEEVIQTPSIGGGASSSTPTTPEVETPSTEEVDSSKIQKELDLATAEKLAGEVSEVTQKVIDAFDNKSFDHKATVLKNTGIVINGKKVELKDSILAENGRTMLPIRTIGEALGLEIAYNAQSKVAVVVKDGMTIEFVLGTNTAIVNGKDLVQIDANNPDVKIIAENGRTYLPVRFIAEQFDLNVNYQNKMIIITKK